MLLAGHEEEHPACKTWVMRCWCGCLSGAKCRLFAYCPADATASQNLIISCLLQIQTGFTFLVPAYPGCSGDTHTHPFNGPFSMTTQVSRYQKGKTNLDFTEARDSEWQWHQLGHMQVCSSLQTDNHASTPPLSLLQAVCPSCRPTNNVKALKAYCPGDSSH